ncbi:RagB/SusD family nutrient uptake outer membrane protein [Paraflavitalea soli]|uniref:RagB/SusD family nutrient uptake outer membrane protein n=1 Tax=Paraflavitalea soli TaxID=2315862 RepID=A0A3B7MSX4_9BACT|nr:RagB/SusD family nutrient uptake outer membrane protein [Paraflavitalea soli]AXY77612.1 RagB/SusD family nutrient uptake outer membrane protein [Paraflavitalea soli]
MKRFFLFITIIALLGSCSKDLQEDPYSIAEETFYNTPAEVAAGVNAIYSPWRSVSSIAGLYTIQLECYADYMYGRGSHAPLNDYAGLDNTNVTRVGDMWRNFYQSIRNANIIIKRTPEGKQISPADVAKFVAEAKFLRALNYFHMVRNWGGVPIRTEANMLEVEVKRNTAAEVYALIVADLLEAEANLPDVPRLVGAPSKWAAKTVLADVYMNLNKWTEARDKANEVINAGKYSLVNITVADDFERVFGAEVVTTSEEIFYLKFSRLGSNQGFHYVMYAHYPGSGYFPPGGFYTNYSDAEAIPIMKNWDRNDLRYIYNWYPKTFGLGANTILNRKFRDTKAASASNAGNDYPMYRYADLLLFYAEAANRANNGPTADAMEKLNMVHRRAYGVNPLVANPSIDFKLADYNTMQSFLDLVVRERMYETCYEGKRWLDLKRLGIVKQVILAAKGKTVADKHLLWPIPNIETNYNKAIDPQKDQNPGY